MIIIIVIIILILILILIIIIIIIYCTCSGKDSECMVRGYENVYIYIFFRFVVPEVNNYNPNISRNAMSVARSCKDSRIF